MCLRFGVLAIYVYICASNSACVCVCVSLIPVYRVNLLTALDFCKKKTKKNILLKLQFIN